jgi:hypothetical protein
VKGPIENRSVTINKCVVGKNRKGGIERNMNNIVSKTRQGGL